VNWIERFSVTPRHPDPLLNVAYGNDTFVVVRDGGSVITSSDGTNWTESSVLVGCGGDSGIAYGNGTFVSSRFSEIRYWWCCSEGLCGWCSECITPRSFTSYDGINWTFGNHLNRGFKEIVYGNGIFVALGDVWEPGEIYSSLDGVNWAQRFTWWNHTLHEVTFGSGTFVAVGNGGTIVTSPDGVNWTVRSTGSFPHLFDVTYGKNTFIIVGDKGTILQSDLVIFDVPAGHWAEQYIISLYNSEITMGCGNGSYCPNDPVTREQMASFIVRAVDRANAIQCTGTVFNDVTTGNPHCANIERLRVLNITLGCAGGNYCPLDNVTRAEMASFLVRAKDGANATVCNGAVFTDVPIGTPHCANIERLRELNITLGCSASEYCPGSNVFRDQMAAFLARAFLGMQ
jgi:hypothetical protein